MTQRAFDQLLTLGVPFSATIKTEPRDLLDDMFLLCENVNPLVQENTEGTVNIVVAGACGIQPISALTTLCMV